MASAQQPLSESELRRVRDLLIADECLTAIKRYSLGVDLNDLPMLREAFHPDAVVEMGPDKIMRGHDEIDDIAKVGVRWADKHHFSMDHQIVIESENVARGLFHGLVLYSTPDLVHVSGTARYRDRFERREGVWRIAHRNVEIRYFAVHPDTEVMLNPLSLSNERLDEIRARVNAQRAA